MSEPPITLTIHDDGRADLSVASNVDDTALAGYLRQLADFVEGGHHRDECTDCANGTHPRHHDPAAPGE